MHTIEITATDEDGRHTATHAINWPGTAADLAARLGAGRLLAHGADWRIAVTAPDGGTVEWTEKDEHERLTARDAIVAAWEKRTSEITGRRHSTPRDEWPALGELLNRARAEAADQLEPLGFRIIDDMVEMVVDVRTSAGLLAAIRQDERDRADAEDRMAQAASDRDEGVRIAIALNAAPAVEIAKAAGVGTARVYQIRDGRR